jgi:tetratricopeptide (TPR) repeat protein
MAVVKYSKRPGPRAYPAPTGRFLSGINVNNMPRLIPVILAALLLSAPLQAVHAQAMPGGSTQSINSNMTTLDTLPPEGGWQALANLLDKAKPSTDTRLTPTPSQITDRIELLLNQGKIEQALKMIDDRIAAVRNRGPNDGTDVQLEFQHARALAALGRIDEAMDVYTQMTQLYPELPEPWNNMAVLYVGRGDIDRAQDALKNALRAWSDYPAAKANMADVQLMLARRSYSEASKLGVTGTQNKARAVDNLLNEKKPQ